MEMVLDTPPREGKGMSDRYINGGCGFTQDEKVLMEHIAGQNSTVIALLDTKMDNLINQLIAKNQQDKDQVPLSVFKWIIVFLLIFTFSLIFGVNAAKEFFGHGIPKAPVADISTR